MVVDRIHDLVTLIDHVEVNGHPGSDFDSEVLVSLEDHDDRDGMAVLRALPGSSLVFRNLHTTGRAILQFGFGVAHPKEGMKNSGAVFLRVEVERRNPSADIDRGASGYETIFEKVCRPEDFPKPDQYTLLEKVLAESGDGLWNLRFTCREEGLPAEQGRAERKQTEKSPPDKSPREKPQSEKLRSEKLRSEKLRPGKLGTDVFRTEKSQPENPIPGSPKKRVRPNGRDGSGPGSFPTDEGFC